MRVDEISRSTTQRGTEIFRISPAVGLPPLLVAVDARTPFLPRASTRARCKPAHLRSDGRGLRPRGRVHQPRGLREGLLQADERRREEGARARPSSGGSSPRGLADAVTSTMRTRARASRARVRNPPRRCGFVASRGRRSPPRGVARDASPRSPPRARLGDPRSFQIFRLSRALLAHEMLVINTCQSDAPQNTCNSAPPSR